MLFYSQQFELWLSAKTRETQETSAWPASTPQYNWINKMTSCRWIDSKLVLGGKLGSTSSDRFHLLAYVRFKLPFTCLIVISPASSRRDQAETTTSKSYSYQVTRCNGTENCSLSSIIHSFTHAKPSCLITKILNLVWQMKIRWLYH